MLLCRRIFVHFAFSILTRLGEGRGDALLCLPLTFFFREYVHTMERLHKLDLQIIICLSSTSTAVGCTAPEFSASHCWNCLSGLRQYKNILFLYRQLARHVRLYAYLHICVRMSSASPALPPSLVDPIPYDTLHQATHTIYVEKDRVPVTSKCQRCNSGIQPRAVDACAILDVQCPTWGNTSLPVRNF